MKRVFLGVTTVILLIISFFGGAYVVAQAPDPVQKANQIIPFIPSNITYIGDYSIGNFTFHFKSTCESTFWNTVTNTLENGSCYGWGSRKVSLDNSLTYMTQPDYQVYIVSNRPFDDVLGTCNHEVVEQVSHSPSESLDHQFIETYNPHLNICDQLLQAVAHR